MEKDHHHIARAPDAQRIWKVTHKLDQLDMMCEQHHLQTKHVDCQPDWAAHMSAAGVALPPRQDIPPNFAWHDYETVESEKPTARMADAALTRRDTYLDERVVLESPVLPLSEELPLQTMTPDDRHISSINAADQSIGNQFETSTANRKRKVQFPDHAAGYRNERSTTDLVEAEVLPAASSRQTTAVTAHYPPDTRSTYQEMYQWPSREANSSSGGIQAAGSEPRHEPHGVFSGNDAVVGSSKSASDRLMNDAGNRVESTRQDAPALNEPRAFIPRTSPKDTTGVFIEESTQTETPQLVETPITRKPEQPVTASTSVARACLHSHVDSQAESKDSPW